MSIKRELRGFAGFMAVLAVWTVFAWGLFRWVETGVGL